MKNTLQSVTRCLFVLNHAACFSFFFFFISLSLSLSVVFIPFFSTRFVAPLFPPRNTRCMMLCSFVYAVAAAELWCCVHFFPFIFLLLTLGCCVCFCCLVRSGTIVVGIIQCYLNRARIWLILYAFFGGEGNQIEYRIRNWTFFEVECRMCRWFSGLFSS